MQSSDPAALYLAENTLISLKDDFCDKPWLLGMVYQALGDLEGRDQARREALRCSSVYTRLVRALAPEDLHLADLAVRAHPGQAEAWFWLAELNLESAPESAIKAYWQGLGRAPHTKRAWAEMSRAFASLDTKRALALYEQLGLAEFASKDPYLQAESEFILAAILAGEQPKRAIQLYRQGLQAAPHDGVRWYELGDLLKGADPQAALEAYHQSCYNGDPGHHGCYPAGLIAEEFGDIQLALHYYRLSKWDEALKKVDQLEDSLP
jgi:tetratricopeptide (TPR) repeat protein